MGLLKKVQARDWSRSCPQSLNHDLLEQSSVRLCHGTKTHYLGVPIRLSIKNPCLLSQHPSGESRILLFLRDLCQTSVSIFRHCPCYRSTINTLEWKKEDDLWADPSILSMFFFGDGGVRFEPARYFYLNMGVKLVMVKDQSLARSSVVRVDCGANALG